MDSHSHFFWSPTRVEKGYQNNILFDITAPKSLGPGHSTVGKLQHATSYEIELTSQTSFTPPPPPVMTRPRTDPVVF